MKLSHNQAVWLMVVVTLLWSTAGVVTRQLEHAQKFEVTFWRSFFTMLCLLVMLPLFKGRAVFGRMRQGGAVLFFSGLCWCGMMTFFMVAIMLTTVANVLVTMALIPLLTALASSWLLGYRIALRTWLAILVAGGGIAFMYASQLNQGISLAGTLVALCLTVAGAANWTLNQYAQAHGKNVDLIPAVLLGAALSALLMLPLAWPFQASAHDYVLLFGLGLFQLAIPCVLVVICARVLKAPEVALLGLLEVIFGIVLVWLGAGEVPTHNVLLGGSLVIGALVANELVGWRNRAVLLS
ncbi:MAG: permease [Comamonadaceae bacterium CG_4_10_14_3_um_filter_60_42]|nr:MAG: permease [Comamonadaceae bacterium CG_4_10_14_3_um_filter_60_42]